MLGFLLYLDTLAFIPYLFVFVVISYAILARRNQIIIVAHQNNHYIAVFAIFLFLCTINTVIHGVNGVPNMYMQVFTLIAAFSLNRDDAKFFVLLTCIECFVGFYEYYFEISSILGVAEEFDVEEDLLYYKRVYGLCTNSSVFSIKILVGLVLLHSIKPFNNSKFHFIFVIILLLGLYVTFNRTIIVSSIIFYISFIFSNIPKEKMKGKMILALTSTMLILFFVFVFVSFFGDSIIHQFSRNEDDSSSMLTGRTYIWASFGQFISENWLFGNGSVHLLVPYNTGPIHAHNSFIQLLADHGIILASIYFFNILFRVREGKKAVFITFVVASLTQYVLFWGFSVNDVFFFALLFNPYFVREIVEEDVNNENVSVTTCEE
jgi:O-antigen ligase